MKIKLLFFFISTVAPVQLSFGMDDSLKHIGTFNCGRSKESRLIAFHPENNKIALLSKIANNQERRHNAIIYDITTNKTSAFDCPITSSSNITAITFDENNKIIFELENSKLHKFNPLTKKYGETTVIQKQTNSSPEKNTSFTFSYLDDKKTVQLWSTKTKNICTPFTTIIP